MYNQALYAALENLFLKQLDDNASRALQDLANAHTPTDFINMAFLHRKALNLNVPKGVKLDDRFLSVEGDKPEEVNLVYNGISSLLGIPSLLPIKPKANSIKVLSQLAKQTQIANEVFGDPTIRTFFQLISTPYSLLNKEFFIQEYLIRPLKTLPVTDLLNILALDADAAKLRDKLEILESTISTVFIPMRIPRRSIPFIDHFDKYDEESLKELLKQIKNKALVIVAQTLNASIRKTTSELLDNNTLPTNESVVEFTASVDNLKRLEGILSNAIFAEGKHLEQCQALMEESQGMIQPFQESMPSNFHTLRDRITKLTDTVNQFSKTSTTQELMACYKEARMAYGITFVSYVKRTLNPEQFQEDDPKVNTKTIGRALKEAHKNVTTLEAKLVRAKLAALDVNCCKSLVSNLTRLKMDLVDARCESLLDIITQFEALLTDANKHALKDAALFTGLDKLEAYYLALDFATGKMIDRYRQLRKSWEYFGFGGAAVTKKCIDCRATLDAFYTTMLLPEYKEAFGKLKLQNDASATSDVKTMVAKLVADVNAYKTSGEVSMKELTSILKNTNKLLLGKMTPKAYEKEALLVQGNPSVAMKVLGGLMIAIGAIIAATLLAATGVGAFVAIGVGTAVATTSIGFFAASRQTGLSKTMSQVADARERQKTALGA